MKKILNLFLRLDSCLISNIERCGQNMQILTGKDNFWLAERLMMLVIILIFIGYFLAQISPVVFGIIFPTYIVILFIVKKEKGDVRDRLSKGLANNAKINPMLLFLRAFHTLGSAAMFIMILLVMIYGESDSSSISCYCTGISFIIFTLILYLIACDPLPPCKGKIKEWLKSLFFNPKPITE